VTLSTVKGPDVVAVNVFPAPLPLAVHVGSAAVVASLTDCRGLGLEKLESIEENILYSAVYDADVVG
jgi:hypothetical protein